MWHDVLVIVCGAGILGMSSHACGFNVAVRRAHLLPNLECPVEQLCHTLSGRLYFSWFEAEIVHSIVEDFDFTS